MSGEFVDTNVLIYAYDESSPKPKRDLATNLLARLWDAQQGVLSTQVLQEFYATATRRKGMAPSDARGIVQDLGQWRLIQVDLSLILQACDVSRVSQISFWDSLIVGAALSASADILWTEDLNAGQLFGSLQIRNPFGRPGARPGSLHAEGG